MTPRARWEHDRNMKRDWQKVYATLTPAMRAKVDGMATALHSAMLARQGIAGFSMVMAREVATALFMRGVRR